MAILSSSRNLLIFGGLGVFALGWGGGLLLGAFNSKDAPRPPAKPQLVDADAYSPSKEGEKSEPHVEKSSSLLEQVFGLDDLEEEKPSSSPRRSGAAAPPADSSNSDLADQVLQGTQPAAQPVELQDSPEAEDTTPPSEPADDGQAPEDESAPSEAKPEKDILGENPYK